MMLGIAAAAAGLIGGLCLAYSFKVSREADFLIRPFRWGDGTAVRFNRDLFRVGVAGITLAAILGGLK
jgi:hypothetical protein